MGGVFWTLFGALAVYTVVVIVASVILAVVVIRAERQDKGGA